MRPVDVLFAALVVTAFLTGLRSTVRLWRRHRDVAPVLLDPRERLVLGTFVVVAVLLTATAGYFGFLSVRRLLGLDALEGTALLSALIASVVLYIPAGLDWVVGRIARR